MRLAEQLGPSRVTERRKTGAGVVEGEGEGLGCKNTSLQKYLAPKSRVTGCGKIPPREFFSKSLLPWQHRDLANQTENWKVVGSNTPGCGAFSLSIHE